MEGIAFTPDDIRQALASCTHLCICQDCQESRDESYKLLAAWLNAQILKKLHRKGQRDEGRDNTSTS